MNSFVIRFTKMLCMICLTSFKNLTSLPVTRPLENASTGQIHAGFFIDTQWQKDSRTSVVGLEIF